MTVSIESRIEHRRLRKYPELVEMPKPRGPIIVLIGSQTDWTDKRKFKVISLKKSILKKMFGQGGVDGKNKDPFPALKNIFGKIACCFLSLPIRGTFNTKSTVPNIVDLWTGYNIWECGSWMGSWLHHDITFPFSKNIISIYNMWSCPHTSLIPFLSNAMSLA